MWLRLRPHATPPRSDELAGKCRVFWHAGDGLYMLLCFTDVSLGRETAGHNTGINPGLQVDDVPPTACVLSDLPGAGCI